MKLVSNKSNFANKIMFILKDLKKNVLDILIPDVLKELFEELLASLM